MFKNKIFLGIFIVAILGIMYYSLNTSANYPEEIKKSRQVYADNLLSENDSPIQNKETFSGFKYFEPDLKYKITATFKAINDSKEDLLLMTDSTSAKLKQAGIVSFELDGKNYQLTLFDEEDILLLPFRDLTNGKETYGGGRYINLKKKDLADDKIEIDFNQAHNFYCAYSENFVCPVPPKENTLAVEIKAGEKSVSH